MFITFAALSRCSVNRSSSVLGRILPEGMAVTKVPWQRPVLTMLPSIHNGHLPLRDQASGTYLYTVNYFGSLFQQQYPAFLCRQITHQRIKILINITELRMTLRSFPSSSFRALIPISEAAPKMVIALARLIPL